MPTPSVQSVLFTARVVVALVLLLPPLWLRLLVSRDAARSFELVRRCAGRVLRLAGVRVQVLHGERLSGRGTVMLVCNHVSLADAAVLLASLPYDFRFVAGHGYAEYPMLGAAIRAASANIVDRGSWRSRADSGRAMVHALAGSRSLLVFPEGTTADDGVILPFRSGAFRAAARTGRPVVPLVIRGTRVLFPPRSIFLTNAPVSVEVLPDLAARDATREGIADLRDRAAAAIRMHAGDGDAR